MGYFLTTIDVGEILSELLDKSPVLAIASVLIWWGYKQLEKKDTKIESVSKEKSELVAKLLQANEDRLNSDNQSRLLLQSIIDGSGQTHERLKEGLARLEKNQVEIKQEILRITNKRL
jgi:hypothetical protein